jgi:hypothetical protein
MTERVLATRVGTEVPTYLSGHGPCDRCGRRIQTGRNTGLHLCRSCRHDKRYIQLVKRAGEAMSNNYYVTGTVTFGVGAWVQGAHEADAMQDFMAMIETFVHEGLRDDDTVSDFRWTNMEVRPPESVATG